MKVGIDIVDVKRIKRLILNKRFLKRVFSDREISYCSSFKNPSQRYAARFAAKEAFIKCLSKEKKPSLKSIEIINSREGIPQIYLDGRIMKNCLLSISHVDEYAVAVCIIR